MGARGNKNPRGDPQGHKSVHSFKRPFKCDTCDYSAKLRGALERHQMKHLSCKERQSLLKSCPKENCDFETIYRSNFSRHMKLHSSGRLFKCNKCNFSFPIKRTLQRHQLIHLSGTEREKFLQVCPTQNCKFTTFYKKNLKRHMLIHSKRKLYRNCPMPNCDFTTIHDMNLQRHLTSHSEKRPYKCEKCDNSFKIPWLLKQHHFIHLNANERDEIQRSCPMQSCSFQTIYRNNLQRHLRQFHSSEPILKEPGRQLEVSKHKEYPKQKILETTKIRHRANKPTKIMETLFEHRDATTSVYACKICSYQTVRNDLLAHHNEDLHSVPYILLNLLPLKI
ncbi:unnamed protein product [Allacma fusca]|uniref:C2H2-type domain-containing protein n=1 Tax=Allacma fusca TaxID=39272 RepID=A0A8J2KZJ6_9HEXA|nr:unnamed protein product [Allacma fusca]